MVHRAGGVTLKARLEQYTGKNLKFELSCVLCISTGLTDVTKHVRFHKQLLSPNYGNSK